MHSERTGRARNEDTELFYIASGNSADPPVMFINGLGSQLINFLPGWVEKFCSAGFYVVRMDNRDVGLSSKTDGEPPTMEALIESWSGDRSVTGIEAPYDLSDMAMDCVAVMNELGLRRTHV